MNYRDGITINGRHSYNDFGLYIAERNIGIPAKKVIKKTVPFRHGAYDYTMINGVPAYEERQIVYGFDITGATIEEMEAEKAEVMAWIYSAQDVDIYDDGYPDTHFHGSYSEVSWDEDGCQGHLTVTFYVYPFRISNHERSVAIKAGGTATVRNTGLPVIFEAEATQGAVISLGGRETSVLAGRSKLPYVLPSGDTVVSAENNDVRIFWREEVM